LNPILLIKKLFLTDTKLVVATGSQNDSGKDEIQELFHPSSNSKSVIGLCTDALSEGVNLQKSSNRRTIRQAS